MPSLVLNDLSLIQRDSHPLPNFDGEILQADHDLHWEAKSAQVPFSPKAGANILTFVYDHVSQVGFSEKETEIDHEVNQQLQKGEEGSGSGRSDAGLMTASAQ